MASQEWSPESITTLSAIEAAQRQLARLNSALVEELDREQEENKYLKEVLDKQTEQTSIIASKAGLKEEQALANDRWLKSRIQKLEAHIGKLEREIYQLKESLRVARQHSESSSTSLLSVPKARKNEDSGSFSSTMRLLNQVNYVKSLLDADDIGQDDDTSIASTPKRMYGTHDEDLIEFSPRVSKHDKNSYCSDGTEGKRMLSANVYDGIDKAEVANNKSTLSAESKPFIPGLLVHRAQEEISESSGSEFEDMLNPGNDSQGNSWKIDSGDKEFTTFKESASNHQQHISGQDDNKSVSFQKAKSTGTDHAEAKDTEDLVPVEFPNGFGRCILMRPRGSVVQLYGITKIAGEGPPPRLFPNDPLINKQPTINTEENPQSSSTSTQSAQTPAEKAALEARLETARLLAEIQQTLDKADSDQQRDQRNRTTTMTSNLPVDENQADPPATQASEDSGIAMVSQDPEVGQLTAGLGSLNLSENDPHGLSDIVRWRVPGGYTGLSEEELQSQNRRDGAQSSLFFQEGIRYQPGPGSRNVFRTVMMTGIPPEVNAAELFAEIRGGAIDKVQFVDLDSIYGVCHRHHVEWHDRSTVARIVFLEERSAIDFARYGANVGIFFNGHRVHVEMVPTPTWPINDELRALISEQQATRCLLVHRNLHAGQVLELLQSSLQIIVKVEPLDAEVRVFEVHCRSITNAVSLKEKFEELEVGTVTFMEDPSDQPLN